MQRVCSASVEVGGATIATIGPGLLVLLGVGAGDDEEDARRLAEKIVGLRIFADADGRFDRALADFGGEVLVVSQFTLYGDTRRGRRPSFTGAMTGGAARSLYETFIAEVRARGIAVSSGSFGADMQVASVNDGPVTLIVEQPA